MCVWKTSSPTSSRPSSFYLPVFLSCLLALPACLRLRGISIHARIQKKNRIASMLVSLNRSLSLVSLALCARRASVISFSFFDVDLANEKKEKERLWADLVARVVCSACVRSSFRLNLQATCTKWLGEMRDAYFTTMRSQLIDVSELRASRSTADKKIDCRLKRRAWSRAIFWLKISSAITVEPFAV